MDKFDCYIEEYTNNENKLCARLREKKSNKKIIIDLYDPTDIENLEMIKRAR